MMAVAAAASPGCASRICMRGLTYLAECQQGPHRVVARGLPSSPLTQGLPSMAGSEALVFDAIRTPRGKGKSTGSLHGTKPVDLVVGLMHEMLSRNDRLDPQRVDDVVLGCVTPVGDQGADIAKTAAIKAGLPDTVAGVQLNRFCASGLEAVNIAAQKIGRAHV